MTWEKSIQFKTGTAKIRNIYELGLWFNHTEDGQRLRGVCVGIYEDLAGTGTLVKLDENFSTLSTYIYSA